MTDDFNTNQADPNIDRLFTHSFRSFWPGVLPHSLLKPEHAFLLTCFHADPKKAAAKGRIKKQTARQHTEARRDLARRS
jgi:hypothetical protein